MNYGVCGLPIIPMRAYHSDKSEMVSQLLFAETFQVLENKNNWIYIQTSFDNYRGWIDEKQSLPLSETDFERFSGSSLHFSIDLVHTARSNYKEQPVLLGSPLPFYRDLQFSFFDDKYSFIGRVINITQVKPTPEGVKNMALKFLNAPYLWGGKTPLGVDCSGLTQMVYKLNNLSLERDSFLQAQQGTGLNKIDEARTGDLAFFQNEEGKIVHVGIMLNNTQIIHAHGFVRIDSVDQQGIYNTDLGVYSHKLSMVRRYF